MLKYSTHLAVTPEVTRIAEAKTRVPNQETHRAEQTLTCRQNAPQFLTQSATTCSHIGDLTMRDRVHHQ